ncbi:hypothetical protein BC833DRAFT_590888 [Globomyces pollinis-pini]|nr:hypothetical protein BC833DRAFT_590888 [Globomyces pollinis-pini]
MTTRKDSLFIHRTKLGTEAPPETFIKTFKTKLASLIRVKQIDEDVDASVETVHLKSKSDLRLFRWGHGKKKRKETDIDSLNQTKVQLPVTNQEMSNHRASVTASLAPIDLDRLRTLQVHSSSSVDSLEKQEPAVCEKSIAVSDSLDSLPAYRRGIYIPGPSSAPEPIMADLDAFKIEVTESPTLKDATPITL